MPNRCARVVVLLGVVLACSTSSLHAQAVFDGTGFASGRDTHTVFPYEHVDPLSGNLLLMTTDLSLPGNAGMHLVVQRAYNSKIHPNFENNQDTTLEERSWVGVGWRLHFGRVINPSTATPGSTLIEMSDGSRHPLQTTTHFPEGWMTREFWRYNRTNHTLKLPNGYIYTFGHVAAPNGLLTDVRYVTRIEDPYGNSLAFTYFAAPGPTDGVQTITQDLGAGQSRTVTFTYNATTKMLATMVYGTRTWTYNFIASNVATHYWLTDVQTPANLTRWHFEYDATLPGGELKSLVAPSGGFVRFVYATQFRVLNQLSVPVRVVTSRTTEAQGVTLGTWSFAYGQGANADESEVTTPCNVERYRYLGVGTAGPFNAWRSGLLAQRSVESSTGTVLEQESLTWGTLEAISPDPIPPVPGGSAGDPAVYPAHLLERVVTRGTQSWRTTFEFHLADGRFNDYGRAYRVRAYDEGNVTYRQALTTYDYSFLVGTPPPYPYVLPVASVAASLGAETATTASTYDLLTGFVSTVTTRGLTTTFTRTARGNVASVRDAVRPATTFEYSWGVVNLITPPAVTPVAAPTITRQVRSDGLVDWEQVGPTLAGRTTYEYDQIGRVILVTPPGGGGSTRWSTTYGYDVTHSRFLRVLTGDIQVPSTQRVVLTDLDYFGRALRTTDPAGVQVEVAYDACGRTTATSLPFSGSTIPGWTTSTYDALGRVLSTTTPTGPGTSSTSTWAYPGGDVTVTDPLSRVTIYDYQAFGDPGAARLRAVTNVDPPDNKVTTYQYTLSGDLAEVRGPGPTGPVRTWTYHATSGLLQSDTQPESGTTSYLYDLAGLPTTVTTADGVATTFAYDNAGRLYSRDVQGTNTADDVTTTYDALGRVASQRLGPLVGGVTTRWDYDTTFGRLTARRDEIDGRTFTSTYAYNAYDDLTGLTYPRASGSGRDVQYDVAQTSGRLTGVRTTPSGGVESPFATDFTYDGSGRLTRYKTGQVVHRVDYDLASRPTRVDVGLDGATGANRLDLTYDYNAASEVRGISDPRSGASQTFTYDTLSRLRTASGGYGTRTWSYDPTGNRTELQRSSGGTSTYHYDGATQRLLSITGTGAESFTPDVLGRVTGDSQGIYTYRTGGAVGTVTRTTPAMSASYDYAADGWRIKRTVNGASSYTIRGVGTQALSTFEVQCGATVWTRDLIYGAGRLLGAIRRGPTAVSVGFDAAASTRPEGEAAPMTVRLTTSDASTIACPITVSYATTAGSATAGQDYTTTSGTLTFPTGSGGASGTTLSINVPTTDDGTDEPGEAFTVSLTVPAGVGTGTTTHTVTLTDNDTPPSLTVVCDPVAEHVGIASCKFTPTVPSGFAMAVRVSTADGTALTAAGDYAPVTDHLVSWAPGTNQEQTVGVSVTDDGWTEPAETVGVSWTPEDANSPPAGSVPLTINANDGTRMAINPAYPGLYLADLDATVYEYLLIANATATATTARLTFVRPDGSGTTRDVAVAAHSRIDVYLPVEPGVTGLVSAAVQTLNASVPLQVEHSQYQEWTGSAMWARGRGTEGAAPASTWYLAEGNVSTFEEYLTVFNLEPVAVRVTFFGYRPNGTTDPREVILGAGPGRTQLRVRDWTTLGLGDHGTRITATRLDTLTAAQIVVERTQEWEADRRGSASTPGTPVLSTTWHLAEGNKGAFDGYYTILNPQSTAQTVSVTYRHENGVTYTGALVVGATSRATFTIPPWVPDGNVGMTLTAPLGIAVERSMYGGTTWTVGHAGVASPVGASTWRFVEGNTYGAYFDTYFAVTNVSATPTTATFTFRTQANTTVTSTLYVPAGARATLYANAVPGLATQAFQTIVTASQPLVVERATYWPGTSGSSLLAGGGEAEHVAFLPPGGLLAGADEADADHDRVLDPATLAERAAARPYVLSAVAPADALSAARAAGLVNDEEQAHLAAVAQARAAFLRKAPPGTQSGIAPPKRTGGTAAGATVTGGATTTAIALPWTGGHLTLGRIQ